MDAKGLLCGFSIIGLFLAIGIWATRLNSPRILAVIAGLMVGGLLGFFLALFWALFSGNMMFGGGEEEHERMNAAQMTELLIIGSTAIIGGLMGFIQRPGRKSKLENDSRDDRRFFGLR